MAYRHSNSDHPSGLVAWRASRLAIPIVGPANAANTRITGTNMSDTEQREVAETFFPSQTREEVRDAIRLEEERRAALVKNLYRLKALRLSRDRSSLRIDKG